MALAEYDLTTTELRLLRAVPTGELVDLSGENDDGTHGPAYGRTIRARMLAEILAGILTPPETPTAKLRLRGALITGPLELEGISCRCPLLLEDCDFDDPVLLDYAEIPMLRMAHCRMRGTESQPALSAQEIAVTHDLDLRGLRADGQVRLAAARVGGYLLLDGARLRAARGPALLADRMEVGCDASLRDGFTATGGVRLATARIGAELWLTGATLEEKGGRALTAYRLEVAGSVWLNRVRSRGALRFNGARVGGRFLLERAELRNPGGYCLSLENATIGEDLRTVAGFYAEGDVLLFATRIGGILSLAGADLTHPTKRALQASWVVVDGSVYLEAIRVRGRTRFQHARIAGRLVIRDAELTDVHLSIREASLGALYFHPGRPMTGEFNLTDARIVVIDDDLQAWPEAVRLRGLTYEALAETPSVTARQRLSWLRRDPDGYAPQPYEQLATVYRQAGRFEDARAISIALQRDRWRNLPWTGRLWDWLTWALVGYGYRPLRAAVWMLTFWLIGALIFAAEHPRHIGIARPDENHPDFNATVYALDHLLPVVDLEHREFFVADGLAETWGWVSVCAGWVFTSALVASLAGLIKRE